MPKSPHFDGSKSQNCHLFPSILRGQQASFVLKSTVTIIPDDWG